MRLGGEVFSSSSRIRGEIITWSSPSQQLEALIRFEPHKSKGQFVWVHGELLPTLRWGQWWRTLLGPAFLSWRVSTKVLRKGRLSESEHFLLAALELHRRVFWLDSPLKASLTSCRRASLYISCCCGYRKRVLNVKSRSLGWLLVTTPRVQELTALSCCPAVLPQSTSASSGDCPGCRGNGGAQQLGWRMWSVKDCSPQPVVRSRVLCCPLACWRPAGSHPHCSGGQQARGWFNPTSWIWELSRGRDLVGRPLGKSSASPGRHNFPGLF